VDRWSQRIEVSANHDAGRDLRIDVRTGDGDRWTATWEDRPASWQGTIDWASTFEFDWSAQRASGGLRVASPNVFAPGGVVARFDKVPRDLHLTVSTRDPIRFELTASQRLEARFLAPSVGTSPTVDKIDVRASAEHLTTEADLASDRFDLYAHTDRDRVDLEALITGSYVGTDYRFQGQGQLRADHASLTWDGWLPEPSGSLSVSGELCFWAETMDRDPPGHCYR